MYSTNTFRNNLILNLLITIGVLAHVGCSPATTTDDVEASLTYSLTLYAQYDHDDRREVMFEDHDDLTDEQPCKLPDEVESEECLAGFQQLQHAYPEYVSQLGMNRTDYQIVWELVDTHHLDMNWVLSHTWDFERLSVGIRARVPSDNFTAHNTDNSLGFESVKIRSIDDGHYQILGKAASSSQGWEFLYKVWCLDSHEEKVTTHLFLSADIFKVGGCANYQ